METIEEAIVEWVRSRPVWLQVLMREVAVKGLASEEFLCQTADAMLANSLALPERLCVTDLPTGSGTQDRVQLRCIGHVENVNALLGEQVLRFGVTGLTAVYGDNGSGKSGYARLIKDVAEARHHERVLPNAFVAGASEAPQGAVIHFAVGDEPQKLRWPDLQDTRTRSIHFHDHNCGVLYLKSDSEVTYQPSALQIFPHVIAAADRLRALLDERLRSLAAEILPALEPDTPSSAFLERVDRTTTQEQIDAATTLPHDAERQLATLTQELTRLVATDPDKERQRLNATARSATQLAEHFEGLFGILGTSAERSLATLQADATRLREAADLASRISFSDEPLPGVATETWRTLWAAAEAYSQAHAYPDVAFPATDAGARCVLCQQELSPEASQRLSRFHTFVHDKTESDASAAEKKLRETIQQIRDIEISSATTSQALTTLAAEDEALTQTLTQALESVERRKAYVLSIAENGERRQPVAINVVDMAALRRTAIDLEARATAVDDAQFRLHRTTLEKQRRDLAAVIELAKYREQLHRHVLTLAERHRLQSLKETISTAQVTAKVTDLTRTYVVQQVRERFSQECQRLGVDKVFLRDRGRKGRLHQRPELEGVGSGETPTDVLSEGEQTALGLAGLFTEVHLDDSKSALVMDDPVSSLSHAMRKIVAMRLVEIAEERQVIVFTHDLTFLGYLLTSARNRRVPVEKRCIERTGGGIPGRVVDNLPWKANDSKERLGLLRARLDRIDRDRHGWSQDELLRATSAWAGELSETYEQVVRTHVAYPLVDRATTEVSARMFRVVAQITHEDDSDFQEGYSLVSEWAKRHDKSEDVNFTPPSTAQMRHELDRAINWRQRIQSYKN